LLKDFIPSVDTFISVECKRYNLNDSREITIRPVFKEEEPQLSDFCKSVTGEATKLIQGAPTPKEIKQVFRFPEYFISLVTEHDGNIIGYGEIKKSPCKKNGELRIFLRKEYQGVGLGTSMMIMLLREATFQGLQKINLRAAAVNLPAVHLFRKFGFQVDEVTTGKSVDGRLFETLYMHRLLNKETPPPCTQCSQALLEECFLIYL
jgi:RimJ/RimL family protein N-acetyltransferase